MIDKIWNFAAFESNTACKDEFGHEMTYDNLSTEIQRLSRVIGGRCLIFILCSNRIGCVLGYTCALQEHVVPVMLSSSTDAKVLDDLMNRYRPRYLWAPEAWNSDFDRFKVIYSAYGYMLMETGYEAEYPLYKELALLLTTSGSTGSPKFVRQSYDNIKANTKSIVEYLQIDSKERPITTLPMHYTYGLSVINTHLSVGASILLTDKGIMQKEFWQFLKDGHATSISGVPYTYEMLDKLRFYRMDLSSLHTLTQAGGKLTPALHEKFAEYAVQTGRNFVIMYGQCEATARMGYLPPEMAVSKKGSMGIAIPGGQFHLEDENGKLIKAPDIVGELVYEGPNVTLGYAERGEDLAKGDERQGILHTGDMAKFDNDGYYYIVGRKKRFLKIYGNRVNLDEMERLIRDEMGTDAACAGVDDHMMIFVESDAKNAEVKAYCAEKTGLNPTAFTIRLIDRIPRNESGKTLYAELERYYGKDI